MRTSMPGTMRQPRRRADTAAGRATRRRAVTLLEVLLSLTLLVALSAMTFWFYSAMLRTREQGMAESYKLRLIRSVMDQMAKEIRQASVITADERVGIRGTEDKLWLSSFRLPSRAVSKERLSRQKPPSGEYDITKVEYSIARHPEILDEEGGWELPLGLARKEVLMPRPGSLGSGDLTDPDRDTFGSDDDVPLDPDEEAFLRELERDEEGGAGKRIGRDADIQWEELYAPEIRYMRLCYYDGHSWWDTWDVQGENPLPQMVMVTMGFEPHAPLEGVRGQDKPNEEFCECLNREPPDCEPLDPDQYTEVVRVAQADPLFRSRVTRETQSVLEDLSEGEDDEENDTGGDQP